jgi:microcystin-dependent protein
MTNRDGFIIPNASDVTPYLLASQPDAGDFTILGNSKYGVISGCGVTYSSNAVSVTTSNNIVVVDGVRYIFQEKIGNDSINITGYNAAPRFDLVVYNKNNGFSVIPGTASANPVFPPITSNDTVLAAIYVAQKITFAIDKRNFLQTSIVSSGGTTHDLVTNYDGAYVTLNIDSDGKSSLGSGDNVPDTFIERESAGVVHISGTKNGKLHTGSVIADDSVTVGGNEVITTKTITWGLSTDLPSDHNIGDLHVNTTNGTLSIVRLQPNGDKGWSNVETDVPTGTVIMSFIDNRTTINSNNPDRDKLKGWLALDGYTYAQDDPILGNLVSTFDSWKVGTDYFTVPNLTGRFPIGAGVGNPINTSNGNTSDHGNLPNVKGTMGYRLTESNIPSHDHQVAASTGTSGGHSHTVTLSGGSHGHGIVGNNHRHFASTSTPIITAPSASTGEAISKGAGQIPYVTNSNTDAPHTIWVRAADDAYTSIPEPSLFIASSDHTHNVTVSAVEGHTHAAPAHSAFGSAVPDLVSLTVPSVSLLFYIKT